METITYAQLAKRLNACKLFNKYPELDENWFDQVQNGTLEYCITHDDCEGVDGECELQPKEIFQWYLIDQSDAEYIMRNSDELIFYSDVLDEYVWGITHFGTSWDGVELEFGTKEEA